MESKIEKDSEILFIFSGMQPQILELLNRSDESIIYMSHTNHFFVTLALTDRLKTDTVNNLH